MREEIFEVMGNDGLVRRGVMTLPDGAAKVMLVILPAGLKYHIGPHRFFVKLARQVSGAGHASLRVDPVGIGESDGAIASAPTREVWRSVEQGRFVKDVALVCKALRERFPKLPIVVAGLCGGAITAQLAGAGLPDLVDAVLSINTAVTLSSARDDQSKTMGAAQAKLAWSRYVVKLFSILAWRRLLSGQSDMGSIRGSILALWKGAMVAMGFQKESTFPNENPAFWLSFRLIEQSRRHHFLVFAANDERWTEFQEIMVSRYLNGRMESEFYEISVVPGANHEFHDLASQTRCLSLIEEWLTRLERNITRPFPHVA